MVKKFSILMTAVAVLAFAIPVTASAAGGTVTSSSGVLAPVGTIVTATNTDFSLATILGTITCAKLTINGEITKNNLTEGVEAINHGLGATENCHLNGTEPATITDPTMITLKSTATGSGTIGLHLVADLPGGITCTYNGTAVPFTYTAGTDTIIVSGTLTPTPALCGTVVKTKLTADFILEIGSTGVIID